MIKALILDMGNVLLRYDPDAIVAPFTKDPEARKALVRELFHGPEWPLGDLGTIDEAALCETVAKRLPEEYHPILKNLLRDWHHEMRPIPGVLPFLDRLQKTGTDLYILSNASLRFREYLSTLSIFPYFKGIVISAEEHLVKPDPAIYRLCAERFHLETSACFFVDDIAVNVEGAKIAGMDGYVFDGDYRALEGALARKGLRL